MTDEAKPKEPESLKAEAAKQAVAFAFGAAFLVVTYFVQRRTGRDFAEAQRDGLTPDSARSRRMAEAKRMERIYGTAGSWALKVANLAWQRAEQARLAYEQERP